MLKPLAEMTGNELQDYFFAHVLPNAEAAGVAWVLQKLYDADPENIVVLTALKYEIARAHEKLEADIAAMPTA